MHSCALFMLFYNSEQSRVKVQDRKENNNVVHVSDFSNVKFGLRWNIFRLESASVSKSSHYDLCALFKDLEKRAHDENISSRKAPDPTFSPVILLHCT